MLPTAQADGILAASKGITSCCCRTAAAGCRAAAAGWGRTGRTAHRSISGKSSSLREWMSYLAVVLVVEVLSLLTSTVLGALAVDVVGALGLGELVNLTTDDAGK
jgi:hypothetical protein